MPLFPQGLDGRPVCVGLGLALGRLHLSSQLRETAEGKSTGVGARDTPTPSPFFPVHHLVPEPHSPLGTLTHYYLYEAV